MNTKDILEKAIVDLQATKQDLCNLCNTGADRDVINSTHKAITRIDDALSRLSDLF